ncbi:MAG: hypothetical protein P8R42_21920 [Candidatus Binatia bacterium]|nr:hypothetical protein [Candidatus Binatia bacterium]
MFSKSVSLLGADGEPIRVVKEVIRSPRYRASIAMTWHNAGGPGNLDRTWRFVREDAVEVDGRSTHKPADRCGYQLYLEERLITRDDVIIVVAPTPAPTPRQQNRGW